MTHSLEVGTRVQSTRVKGAAGLGTVVELRNGDEKYGVNWDARGVVFSAFLHADFEVAR